MPNKKEVAVAVKNVHKEFILPQSKNSTFKQTVVNIAKKNNKVTQKVLDGVSFEINKGDFFGIVGRNGSGKSTLLKLIAGVYAPTSGEIQLNGELTPFIELGVGFNPELSGRDNVYLNGALLGFNRKQMDKMYEGIVEFAELEQFMDQKLKNYSSGMQVRLAFSIAIKAKNEILIFDEVLAVGDEAFQRKCLDVFERYKAEGQTVILVTHDMETVRQFCTKAMLISQGKVVEVGNPRSVAQKYSDLNQEEIDKETKQNNDIQTTKNLHVNIVDTLNKQKQSFSLSEMLRVNVVWSDDINPLESIGVNIFKESGEHITGHNTRYGDLDIKKTNNKLSLEYRLDIRPGKYFVVVEAYREEGRVIEAVLNGPRFTVLSDENQRWSGLVDLPHTWIVNSPK